MIYGRSCKNPPYKYLTVSKDNSLGQIITVKKRLDLWWNSVRVRVPGKTETACIYKCYDGSYETYELEQMLGCSDEEVLKLKIKLDGCEDEDLDGYPIVYATLVEKEGK